MRRILTLAAFAAVAGLSTQAHANGLIQSPNGTAQIGINDDGSLDASTTNGYVGIGYNFSGQGGRFGFQDALTPGCACEAWGVSANGLGGQVGQSTGNQNIGVNASSAGTSNNAINATALPTFVSNTYLSTLPGLTITQTYSLGAQTSDGALFKNTVVIHNGTGATVTDLRYARAMDWDVPPTEFNEFVSIVGTGTTSTLLHSTDNGFANANPLTAVSDTGIIGPNDSDGTTGPADHGSLFVFGFGDLLAGADYTFNIFYGATLNQASAITLLGLVSPELYSLGMSNNGGAAATDLPTYVFAFNGVGGSVVVPGGVPEPSTWAMMIVGLAGLGYMGMRRRQSAAA